jgi:xanthine dehydrogenase accessory factor
VHIAQVLVPMARLAGYSVSVIDPRGAFVTPARFPDTDFVQKWPYRTLATLAPDARSAAVALTHDPKPDGPALSAALASEAFCIGALGSRRTDAHRLERLAEEGIDPIRLEHIYGPAGLDIGACSPAEIALSILAEMALTLRRQAGP